MSISRCLELTVRDTKLAERGFESRKRDLRLVFADQGTHHAECYWSGIQAFLTFL
jgi:hypothetical protein